jgi:NADH:ubiquinone oxidoreductase subunit D
MAGLVRFGLVWFGDVVSESVAHIGFEHRYFESSADTHFVCERRAFPTSFCAMFGLQNHRQHPKRPLGFRCFPSTEMAIGKLSVTISSSIDSRKVPKTPF